MKGFFKPIFAVTALTLLMTGTVQADTEEKMIIALKTDDFEMIETDVSSLAVGESQTIESDSGQVIDLLRTRDGVEIYVDGELLEMDFDREGLHEEGSHGDHMIKKHVEVICDGDEECDKMVWISEGDDIDLQELHEIHMDGTGEGHKVIMIKKHVVTED